jgi:putative membrane protein
MSTTLRLASAVSALLIAQAAQVSIAQTAPGTTRSPATETMTPAPGANDASKHSGMMKKDGAMKRVDSQSFVSQAATTDMAEIDLAQLAMSKTEDDSVRKFASQMVKDHTATSTKLKGIAAKNNLTVPTTLDPEHAAVKTKLTKLSGKEFDAAYGMEMAKGHDKAVALFESASQAPAVADDLKSFASSTLPDLRKHQSMAHGLHGNEGA